MTNKEIISHLLHIQSRINMTFRTMQEQEEYEALDMAIKALEQNESAEEWYKLFVKKLDEQEPCTDAVSIDAVIEWLKDKDIIKLFSQEETARKELKALSSVTQKSGKWLKHSYARKCSECGSVTCWMDDEGTPIPDKFCSNCGAKMESEE